MPPITGNYAIVTAAYNEERYIEPLLRSVVAQTRRPERWVVVSDGSTDRTDEIILQYASQHKFIQPHRITETHVRNWSAQADAMNTGFRMVEPLNTAYIGNLDADVTFNPDYFERLVAKLDAQSDLGIAGGFIRELQGGEFRDRKGNNPQSVPLAVQLFRRECFAVVRPYTPLATGGSDWYAEILARMAGWRVRSFPDLPVNHHRPTGSAGGFKKLVRYWYQAGLTDYGFGTLVSFELPKLARRLGSRPPIIGVAARLIGFCSAHLRGQKRLLPEDVIAFLRNEQRQRLREFFGLRRASGSKIEQQVR
jgi:glycosyltransferase involved in cell wall biosynthesis